MNPRDPNVQQLQLVAQALGFLREQVVFVGGCAAGLLITDAAKPPVRATQDVDLVAEVTSRLEYYELAKSLRKQGFREDVGDVICRWRLGDLKIDVIPMSEEIMNFSNRWHADAVTNFVTVALPDGTLIRLISAPYFVATKLEAFYNRGNGDYLSHDIEDILNLVDGRPSIADEIAQQKGTVAQYLRDAIDDLLSDETFLQTVPSHFMPNEVEQARIPVALARLRKIAGI